MNTMSTKELEESLKSLGQHSDTSVKLKTLIQLGRNYQTKRQYPKALFYSRQAVELVKGRSNLDHRIIALVNTGCVYWEMSQLKKAMGFFQNALPTVQEVGDGGGRMMLSAIIGVSYWRKGEWSSAADWFEKALHGFPVTEVKILQSIDPWKYEGLMVVMERGVTTLKNRIQTAQNQNDSVRILLPSFSMVPLLFFTGRREEIPALLQIIIPLAQQLKKNNILSVIPVLKKIMEIE